MFIGKYFILYYIVGRDDSKKSRPTENCCNINYDEIKYSCCYVIEVLDISVSYVVYLVVLFDPRLCRF